VAAAAPTRDQNRGGSGAVALSWLFRALSNTPSSQAGSVGSGRLGRFVQDALHVLGLGRRRFLLLEIQVGPPSQLTVQHRPQDVQVHPRVLLHTPGLLGDM
jgi:hypothetical protein